MAKRAKNKINLFPYIAKRPQGDGTFKPRFVPGSRERAMGYKGADLKHENSRWFTLDEASGWALAKQAEITAQRKTGKRIKSPPVPRGRTVDDLWEAFIKSDAFKGNPEKQIKGLAASSQEVYLKFIKPLKAEPLWHAPVASLDPIILKAVHEKIRIDRGLSMANGGLAALGSALAWGRLHGWLPKINGQVAPSPYSKLGLAKPEPRIRVAASNELMALIAAADHTFVEGVALSGVGDAIATAFCSGQRKKDIIEFVDAGTDGDRFALRQSKTGAIVSIPRMPMIVDRLAQGRERRRKMNLKVETLHIIINDRTGKPYTGAQLRTDFSLVRAVAIAGIVDEQATAIARAEHAAEHRNTELPTVWTLPPCPSLADPMPHGFTFPDLRDTAVTWLARAECTIPEIASITGHTLSSVYAILKHYLQIDKHLADNAIRKLMLRMEAEGLAI